MNFFCIDGATVRFAATDNPTGSPKIRGYYPNAVQLYQGSIWTTYYPWEISIGIRNPSTNIMYNGYGISELELLIKNSYLYFYIRKLIQVNFFHKVVILKGYF